MKVFIITYCRKPELYYGTELIFSTIRIGFPNADIHVIDNASVIYKKTEKHARRIEANFTRLNEERTHAELIREILTNQSVEIVLVDPDVIFWKEMTFNSTTLISGRRLPKFYDPYTKCLTHSRIHTSLLHIKDPQMVMEIVNKLEKEYFDFDAIKPQMIHREGTWERWDTLSSLYQVKPEIFTPFTEQELNSYDHLFCGSHLDLVKDSIPEMEKIHTSPLPSLKGIWKRQEQVLASYG